MSAPGPASRSSPPSVLDLTHDHPLPQRRVRGRCGDRRAAADRLCSTTGTAPAQDQADATSDADPGVGHLHDLGVDPADGTLYAAGHLGVFGLIPTGAVRITDRYQDAMGFTVTGPRTLLAGNHPSPTAPAATSPYLGLIRSADAGQTWTTVSAADEADFHSLQQAGLILHGLDSRTSQVWAGKDVGATWERRAKIPADDLAVPPRDAAGGVDGRPRRAAAQHRQRRRPPAGSRRTGPGRRGAAGSRPADRPHRGTARSSPVATDGISWTERGCLPGGVRGSVLTAVGPGRLLAADSNDAVHESKDGGRTWTTVHQGGHTNTGH
ncbi:hypothetical protein [Streptomyces sp. Wb2n-11]|uniref:hypothetical protein n=1 Tax=Streptomyces sp. Wb2n-11 TaxID=1030533 RepID=UPI000A607D9A|nr:hypothetical protein [Streptomyces sp. Wb2n-11]